jgi:hypothetical protein
MDPTQESVKHRIFRNILDMMMTTFFMEETEEARLVNASCSIFNAENSSIGISILAFNDSLLRIVKSLKQKLEKDGCNFWRDKKQFIVSLAEAK